MTAHSTPGDLWLGDDPMPSCDPCMSGDHAGCDEWLMSGRYGSFACGCENERCQ